MVDVCGALTDSPDAGAYWRKLKQRLKAEGSEVVTNCHGLKPEASDGKKYTTDCAGTKIMFRIIQKLQPLAAEISWTKNIIIMERCKDELQREFYIKVTKKFGWTKDVLMN